MRTIRRKKEQKRNTQLNTLGKIVVTLGILIPVISLSLFAASNKLDIKSEYTPRTTIYNSISNTGRDVLASLVASEPDLTSEEQIALINVVFNNAEYMDMTVESVVLKSNHPFKSTEDLSILSAKPKSKHYAIVKTCLEGVNNVGDKLYFDYKTTNQDDAIQFTNIQVY